MSANHNTGSLRHAHSERAADCYQTPVEAIRALTQVEQLPHLIWEPACGPGAIVRHLREAGHRVIATDLHDYGLEDSEAGRDFLVERAAPDGVRAIVTNPPYMLANGFIRHGLELCETVIVLLRLAYLEGSQRSDLIDRHLARVWLGRERLPMMHREGWTGPKVQSAAMPFAWFVFTKAEVTEPICLQRMSWRAA